MRIRIAFITALMFLAATLAACSAASFPDNDELPEAPTLYISLNTDSEPAQQIQAIQLTTSWSYMDENGVVTHIEADSWHPLQLDQDYFNDATIRLINGNGDLELQFSDNYTPSSLSVQRWNAEYAEGIQDIYDVLDKSEKVKVDRNTLKITDDSRDYIYEVKAKWLEGIVYYTFRSNIN